MKKWLLKMLEDSEGIPDEARVSAMLLVLSFITLAGWDLMALAHAFNAQNYGIGIGALAAGIGGWFKMRGDK